MKTKALILTCLCIAGSMTACVTTPIATRATIDPQAFEVGKRNSIVVEACNQSNRRLSYPPYLEWDGEVIFDSLAGVGFVRDLRNSSDVLSDSLDMCPPSSSWIEPSEERRFQFYWTPQSEDIGSGFLVIEMPSEFAPIEPLKITVVPAAE